MVGGRGLWQPSGTMIAPISKPIQRTAWFAALIAWLAWGFPMFKYYMLGGTIRDYPISPTLFIPFAIFGIVMLVAMARPWKAALLWPMIAVEVAAVVAMVIILPWAGISQFLAPIAWQVALITSSRKGLVFAFFQTGVLIAAMAQSMTPDLCWVFLKSLALQLLLWFMARALKREAQTARSLAKTNEDLRAAHAIIANAARDAERLRISRELHDAWGHELTALGLQLEIASNITEPAKAKDHVTQAKGLARQLLGKVRDVVSTLREAERGDLDEALRTLAKSVPAPAIHVDVASDVHVSPDQAHALVRCAQEAVTNAVRHAQAKNLWLRIFAESNGVRLVARDDGKAVAAAATSGSGLIGMRERLEQLGGRLAIKAGSGAGFTVDAWLPTVAPQPA